MIEITTEVPEGHFLRARRRHRVFHS